MKHERAMAKKRWDRQKLKKLHRERVARRVRGFLPGDSVTPQYQVLEQLGEGVEGVVYRVWDRFTHSERALKFFIDETKVPFFAGLAKKMLALQHPNIVQIFGVRQFTYRKEPVYFLEMECVVGPILGDYIQEQPGRRLGPFEALRLFADVVRAMSFAHRQGYVHEDLHSDNVILSPETKGRYRTHTAKVNDFFPRGRSATRELKRQDVKALGRLLFEMLTGKLDYRTHYLSRMPPELSDLIRDCYRQPPRGFPDAGDLELALRELQWF